MKFLLQYRKTALIVCAILFGFFIVHLAGAYIYSDGKYVGLPGGSVSVGIVSDTNPEPMNPLLYGTGQIDNMLYNLLFRSLIHYNPETEIFEGDLANCDTSNLQKIQCTLREDAIWSDESPITSEDVIATLKTFSEKALSKHIRNALKNANISAKGTGSIIIESSKPNPGIIEALSFPIIRSDVIDQIKNNRLKKESYITSGSFVYDETEDNREYGFHRITLKKNPNYKKTVWLDKFHFKIFKDLPTLERAIETTTIILPPANREIIKTPTLFKNIPYANYEYFGIFFNTDTLDKNIRNILHKQLSQRFSGYNPTTPGQIMTQTIFGTGGKINGITPAMNFESFMNEKGYKKKYTLLAETHEINTTLIGGATVPKLKYFTNYRGNSILFSDDPRGKIAITGRAPNTTTSVTINGYTLKEYNPGNTSFLYRSSLENGSLKNGKNIFKLELQQKDGKVLTENLTLYYTTNADEMARYKSEVDAELIKTENTPEKIEKREQEKQEIIKKIETLDDSLYYNSKYEPYTLKLAFMNTKEITKAYMNIIENSLKKMGISLNIQPLSSKELDAIIKSGKKDYDFILVGVRSPGTISDLGKTFFSSENGNPNFSNIKSKKLSDLFESLQNVTEITKSEEIQKNIIEYMNDFSFFLPISRPEHTFYIDRNIKGLEMPEIITSYSDFATIFDTLSIKDYYEKNTKNKSIGGFISWIGNSLSQKNN